jgi:hypothetical protein
MTSGLRTWRDASIRDARATPRRRVFFDLWSRHSKWQRRLRYNKQHAPHIAGQLANIHYLSHSSQHIVYVV